MVTSAVDSRLNDNVTDLIYLEQYLKQVVENLGLSGVLNTAGQA